MLHEEDFFEIDDSYNENSLSDKKVKWRNPDTNRVNSYTVIEDFGETLIILVKGEEVEIFSHEIV